MKLAYFFLQRVQCIFDFFQIYEKTSKKNEVHFGSFYSEWTKYPMQKVNHLDNQIATDLWVK